MSTGLIPPPSFPLADGCRLDELVSATSFRDPSAAARLVTSVQEGAEEGERLRGSLALTRRARHHRHRSLAWIAGRLTGWQRRTKPGDGGAESVLLTVARTASRAAEAADADSSSGQGLPSTTAGGAAAAVGEVELLTLLRGPLLHRAVVGEGEEEDGSVAESLLIRYVCRGVGEGVDPAALLAIAGRELGIGEATDSEDFIKRCTVECALVERVTRELDGLAAHTPAALRRPEGGHPRPGHSDKGSQAFDPPSRPRLPPGGSPDGEAAAGAALSPEEEFRRAVREFPCYEPYKYMLAPSLRKWRVQRGTHPFVCVRMPIPRELPRPVRAAVALQRWVRGRGRGTAFAPPLDTPRAEGVDVHLPRGADGSSGDWQGHSPSGGDTHMSEGGSSGGSRDATDPGAWLLCALYTARILAQKRRRCVSRAAAAAAARAEPRGEGSEPGPSLPEDCSALRLLASASPGLLSPAGARVRGSGSCAAVQPSLAACREAQRLLDALTERRCAGIYGGEGSNAPTPYCARPAAEALLNCVEVLQAAWACIQQQPRPSAAPSGPTLVTERDVSAMQAAVFHASWRTLLARVCALGRESHLERLLAQLGQRAAAAKVSATGQGLHTPSQEAAVTSGPDPGSPPPAVKSLVRLQAHVRGAVTRLRYGFHARAVRRPAPEGRNVSKAEKLFVAAHIQHPTTTGDTPLTLAVKRGHVAVVSALVRAGADPWAPLLPGAATAGRDAPSMPVSVSDPPSLADYRDALRMRQRGDEGRVPGLPAWAAAMLAFHLGPTRPERDSAVASTDAPPRHASPHLTGPVVAHLAVGDARMLRALGGETAA